jgi:hypothetical protein
MFKITKFSSGSGPDWFPGRCSRAVALNGAEGLKRGMRGVTDPLRKAQEWHIGDATILYITVVSYLEPLLKNTVGVKAVNLKAKVAWRHYVQCRPLLRILRSGQKKVKVLVEGRRLEHLEVENTFRSPCLGKTELFSFAKPVEQDEINHYISRIKIPIKFISKKERFSRFLQEYVSTVTAIFTAKNDRKFYWYWYIRSTVKKSYLYHISQTRYQSCKKIVNAWMKLRICLVMTYDELRLRQRIKSCARAEWLDKLASLRACYPKRDPCFPQLTYY